MIINAPWVFTFAWKIVTTFLDPGTLAKISIVGSDYQESLIKVMEKDQIPQEYGGTGKSIKEICYSKQSRAFIPTQRPSGEVALKGDYMYCQQVANQDNQAKGGVREEIDALEGIQEVNEANDSEGEVQSTLEEHVQEPGITSTVVHTVSDDLSTDSSGGSDDDGELVATTMSATTAGPTLRKWDLVKFVAAPQPKTSDQLSSVVESMQAGSTVTSASPVTMSEEVEPNDISVSSVSDDNLEYEDDSGFEQVPVLEPQTVPDPVERPAPKKWNLVKSVVTHEDDVQNQENATIASAVMDTIAQRNETQTPEEVELLRPIDSREYGNETEIVEEQGQSGAIDSGEYGDEEIDGGRSSESTTCRENSTTEGSISPSVTRKTTSPVELPSGDVKTSRMLDRDGTIGPTSPPLRTSSTSRKSISNEMEAEDRMYDEDDVDSDEDDINFLSNLRAAEHVSYKPTKHPIERNKTAEVEPWKVKDFNNVGGGYHDRSCATPDCNIS